jgi:hypothetical protein
MTLLRCCYRQIFRPDRHLAKFADGLPRQFDLWVHLYPHLIWQAAKSQLECSYAFGFVPHEVSPLTWINMTALIPDGATRYLLRRYYGATGITPNSGSTDGRGRMAFSSKGLTSRQDKQQKKVEQERLEAALEGGLKGPSR